MNDRTTYPTGLLTFLLGGLAGAGIALLLAPRSGRETRDTVRQRMRDGVDAARDLGQRVISRGRDVRDEAGRALSDALDDAQRGVERVESRLRSTDTSL